MEPSAHAQPRCDRFPVSRRPARPGGLGEPVPAARPAPRGRSHPVLAQPHRLPAHRRGLRGRRRRRPRPPFRRHVPAADRGHRSGPGHRGRRRPVRRRADVFLDQPGGRRPERPLRPVRAVQPRRDLLDLRPRTAPAGQGLPVLRDQGRAGGQHRPAAGGGRAARLLRQVGHLAGRPGRAGRGAPRGRRPVRGPVPLAGAGRGPGHLHRRDPRRAVRGRQPQRRRHPEEQRPGRCGCRRTTSRTPSTTT